MLLLLLPRRARAEDACRSQETPRVAVRFEGALWGDNLRAEILEHLKAGLAAERLAICREIDISGRPLARIALSRDDPDTVAVRIDVRDDVTGKRVVRSVDLRHVPPDGRALGVAVAADELLRASWVELALADRPEPPAPPPPQVEDVMVESLDRPYRPREPRHQLGTRAAVERYTGGQTQLGGDLAFRTWFSTALGLEVSLGLRDVLAVETPLGSIGGYAAGGGAALLWNMTGAHPLSLQAEVGQSVALIHLRGSPTGDAVGKAGSAFTAFARAGLALSYDAFDSFGLRLRAGAGAPIATVSARQNDRTKTGVSGLEIYGGLGAYARF